MKLKNLFVIFYSVLIAGLVITSLLAISMLRNQKELIASQNLHFKSYILANELRQSSDDLSRYCKTYILTEDTLWETKYWAILSIRNGKKPRPDGRTIALIDSLKKLGLTEDEFNKLKEAELNSNELVKTEMRAFNAVKGLFEDSSGRFTIKRKPDTEFAHKLLFDKKYYSDKERIIVPIQEFISLIDKRTTAQLDAQNEISMKLLFVKISLIVLLIIIAVLSFFILKVRILKKLEELNVAYKKIEESEEQFYLFMNSIPGLAYIKDNESKFLFSNDGFSSYLKIDNKEMINKATDEIFPADFAALIDEDDNRILKTGKSEIIEYQYEGKSWSTHKFLIPRKDKPPCIGGISIDVTDAKLAEETTRKLYRAVEQSSVSIVITDTKGCIEYVNPKFRNLTGYSFEEVKGANPSVLKSNYTSPETYRELWTTISAGKEWKGEFCNIKKNKELYWESASISPIFDSSGVITHYLAIKEDITEKRNIEKALAESEEKYRISFNNSPDSYFIIVDEIYADCNNSASIMLNAKREDIIGQRVGTFTFGRNSEGRKMSEAFKKELKYAFDTGKHIFEWLHYRPDGTEIYAEISVVAITWEGKPALFATWRDITQRKLTEEALKLNETRLQEAQTIGHIGNWEVDLARRYIKGSDEATRIYGLEPGTEYPLDLVQDLVLPEYRQKMDVELKGLLAGTQNYDLEFKIRRFNDGAVRWLHSKGELINDAKGTPPRVVGIIQDITERKIVEEELHRNRTFLYDIIENNGALIFVKNCEGVYQLVNKKWEDVTGLKRDYVLGRTDIELFPGIIGTNFRQNDLQAMNSRSVEECEEVFEGSSGNRYFLSIKFPMREGEDKIIGICGISTEITERKRSEAQNKKFTEELQELNYTKDKFFSIIAHDLKNPFHGLLNLSRMLLQDYTILSEDEKISFIKSIEDLSNNTYKLLENLLDWSRIQTGRMTLMFETFNLFSELYPTITLLRQTAANKGIDLSYSVDELLIITADKNMLATVVRNLLSNSIKFTQRGGKISLNVKVFNSFIQFSITDSGVGIEKESLENLFRIDKNIKTLGTEKEKGTGIGLLLCKELVEKHDGKIWAESEQGKETTFYFTIPMQ